MILNFRASKGKDYYFDSRLAKNKVVRPLLDKRNRVLVIAVTAILFTSFLWMLKSQIDHRREINELKTLISAFVSINRYSKVSDDEIVILAEEVYRVGKKYHIDPLLILSVITIESNFNREAVSHMGARGLMQLLPATARHVAEELNMDYTHYSELSDIRKNITLGTHYLHKLSERYNKNMILYLTAYNYGPENVDRMLRETGSVPTGYSSKIMRTYNRLSF